MLKETLNKRFSMFSTYHLFAEKLSKGDMKVYGEIMYALNVYGLNNEELENLSFEQELALLAFHINIENSVELSKEKSNAQKKSANSRKKSCNLQNENVQLAEINLANCEEEDEEEDEIEKEEEREGNLEPIPAPQTTFAKQIFDKFSMANLPCWNNNFISWLNADFKNTYLARQGLHSKDILQAVDNYITEYKSSDSFVKKPMTFETLIRSSLWNQLLPANYRHEAFLKTKSFKQQEIERKENEQIQREKLKEMKDAVLNKFENENWFDASTFLCNLGKWQASGYPSTKELLISWFSENKRDIV